MDVRETSLSLRVAWAAAFALAATLLITPWLGHFDDTDAQLYQVVIRKMAERRAWMDPGYLDHFAAHYRDHLPFGIWPFAIAQVALGEFAPRVVAASFSLATLAGLAVAGRKLLGEWPALAAVLVLATTETFFRYGGATRLDPLLVLLANAAAVPFLLGWRRWPAIAVAGILAALATLVKGPFGLVPLLAAAGARAWADRSFQPLARGVAAALLASLPLLGFLMADHFWLYGGWWETYGLGQLLASATGARSDGSLHWWFPLATVIGRFWPGMALIAACLVLLLFRPAMVSRNARLVMVFCVLMLVALCIPGRKVWNHALIAYPGLALFAGLSIAPFAGWLGQRWRASWVAAGVASLALIAMATAPLLGKLVDSPQCVASLEFSKTLDTLPAGSSILVVSSPTSWRTLASLSAERRLEPIPLGSLPAVAAGPGEALAIVQDDLVPKAAGAWEVVRRARGWTLMRTVVR